MIITKKRHEVLMSNLRAAHIDSTDKLQKELKAVRENYQILSNENREQREKIHNLNHELQSTMESLQAAIKTIDGNAEEAIKLRDQIVDLQAELQNIKAREAIKRPNGRKKKA